MDGSMNVKYTLYDFRTTTKSRDDAFLRTYPRLEATHDLSDWRSFVVSKLPEDGTVVSKRVAVGT